jgi:hypothetical protein
MNLDGIDVGERSASWREFRRNPAGGRRRETVRYLTLARGSNHSRNPGGIV